MPRRNKSFYDLEFSVDPGGARKDAHYIRGTLDQIKADLKAELDEQLNLYLLCWYGARIELRVFERGELTKKVDLHPAIAIVIDGYPEITFAGPGKPIGHTFKGEEDDTESLSSRMFEGSLEDVNVTVAWNRLAIPELTGELVGEGDFVSIDDDWQEDDDAMDEDELLDCGYLPYGFTDREA